ncbi:cilia- and flagella-associated protein 57 [Nilaparvata lugens]|uniref:cilia- and flagella-associated protein 57 n=1 Tax=Nilaparvata lugens TaxID=108931 RepID=UPI00193D8C8F|nr:cilia- and flagella-associated protein 57 [Nilaparvata lugens]
MTESTATAPTIPQLQPHLFLGLNNTIKGNATFITDDDILYPAGGVLVIHNYLSRTQRYIKLPRHLNTISMLVVSPNKNVVAVVQEGDKPSILLYDLQTLKRKKVLNIPYETTVRKFASVAFTSDNKYVVAITASPDWMMLFFLWEKGKIETSTKANSPPANTGAIVQVAPNLTDNTVVSLVGPGIFRLLAVSDMVWRQYGFQKADTMPFSTVCWLTPERVVAGTRDGRLVFVEFGDLRALYRALEATIIDVKVKDESAGAGQIVAGQSLLQVGSKGEEGSNEFEVRCLTAFSRGFCYTCTSGIVILFEKESNSSYRKRNVFRIVAKDVRDCSSKEMNEIHNLSISPNEEKLLCTTKRMQIYFVQLWGQDIAQCEEISFELMGEGLHHGPITGVSLCAWKQEAMTCGWLDRTVCVWDYVNETVLLNKVYQEDVYCITLHPTGLYAVLGFSDKLRFLLVLIDDLHVIREFPIRCCNEAQFSRSGHMFAAMNVYNIHVYSSITFQLIYTLKGHNNKVTSNALNVHEFSLENVFPCSQTAKEVDIRQTQLDCIVLSRSDQMMFVAGDNGSVLSVRFPWVHPPEYQNFQMHNHRILKMKLTYDDKMLITTSTDGTMCLWKVTAVEGKTINMDPNFTFSNEILISKDDLQDKIRAIKDQTLRIKQLDTEHAYQTRQMQTAHKDEVDELQSAYLTTIEQLKDKNQDMETEHTIEINKINRQIADTKLENEQEVEKLESSYNAKLIVEYDKYSKLEGLFESTQQKCNKNYEDLLESKRLALEEISTSYEKKLDEKRMQIKKMIEAMEKNDYEHEVIKLQMEKDSDKEIVELNNKYEDYLNGERDLNIRLRGETGVMKKKILTAHKDIEELKYQVFTLQNELLQLNSVIEKMEKKRLQLHKEIAIKDNSVRDKEGRILEVKGTNDLLEKYRTVLSAKISELQDTLEPSDKRIESLKDVIAKLESEMEDMQNMNAVLKSQGNELEGILENRTRSLNDEIAFGKDIRTLLKHLSTDMAAASRLIQHPTKLKEEMKKLYERYNRAVDLELGRGHDKEADLEFERQMKYLQKAAGNIKSLIYKASDNEDYETNVALIKSNMSLMNEMDDLRVEVAVSRQEARDLDCLLGLDEAAMPPSQASATLTAAIAHHATIHKHCQADLQKYIKKINLLKQEINCYEEAFAGAIYSSTSSSSDEEEQDELE